jgi:hypothetical protein
MGIIFSILMAIIIYNVLGVLIVVSSLFIVKWLKQGIL